MFVKPANPDLKVPDAERGGYLPADGAEVPNTTYWRRRLAKGDVVDASPEPSPAAPASTSKAKG